MIGIFRPSGKVNATNQMRLMCLQYSQVLHNHRELTSNERFASSKTCHATRLDVVDRFAMTMGKQKSSGGSTSAALSFMKYG